MIRKLIHKREIHQGNSAKRNYEVQRIETFSDGVFAFAVTLLIVSLEVPKNFEELMVNIRGFFAFGISFLLLVVIWMEQHNFFRKYGLEDGQTIALNVALLFLVLFYVYPLKFLFTLVFSSQIYAGHEMPLHITDAQMPVLMEIYAAGFIAIYSLFTLMYRHALARSSFLELTEAERFDCRTIMYKQVIMVSVGVSALFSAMIISAQYSGITGFIYVLIGPALTPFFFRRKKIRDRLFPEEKEVNA